jgi:DNA (cytosine-5)-methyltransferase 1
MGVGDGLVARPFNILALCAGVGGLELGLKLAVPGARLVGACERDPFAAAVLVARMAEAALDPAPIWDDLRTFDGRPWRATVDCITAGFPCQPWSTAGKRLGMEDERWLWPDIARIIREVQPGWVFLENVPRLVSGGLGAILADLAACGFDAEWDCFSAADLGAPHKRERIFLLAHAHGGWARHPDRDEAGGEHVVRAEREEGAGGPRACDPLVADAGRTGCEVVADAADAAGAGQDGGVRGAAGSTGPGGGPVADSGGREGWLHAGSGEAGSGAAVAGGARPAVADADWVGRGADGRQLAHEGGRADAHAEFPLFPFPNDPDHPGWRWVAEHAVQLWPHALPEIRRMADGTAYRVDRSRIRVIGEGVVPLVAAFAWCTLRARLAGG